MTPAYDPSHPGYFDAGDLAAETERVFDLCHGCRLCFNLCPSFPSLFDFVDAHDGEVSALTGEERDVVADQCYQCKLCYVKCPYGPPHDWALDFPRLMLRVEGQPSAGGHGAEGAADRPVPQPHRPHGGGLQPGRTTGERRHRHPGSLARRLMERTVGVAAERVLPPTPASGSPRGSPGVRPARHPLVLGLRRRSRSSPPASSSTWSRGSASDLVGVLERNAVECSLPEGARCCGAPWLHSGNVAEFERAARRNVAALAPEVRAGQRRGGAPADLQLRPQARLPPLSRDGRRRAGVPAHLRPRRVPSGAPPRRGAPLGPRVRGRGVGGRARPCHVPRGLPPAGPEHGAEEPGPAQAGGDPLRRGAAVFGHRRDLGLPGRQLSSSPARWPPPWPGRSALPATRWSAATAPWPTGPSSKRPAPRHSTPSACSPAPTGSRRRRGGAAVSEAPAGGLTVDDIFDLRAYERVRDDYRRRVMEREAPAPCPARPGDHRGVRVRRHRAVPGPGDGPGRADLDRRGDPRASSTPTTGCCRPPGSSRPPCSSS